MGEKLQIDKTVVDSIRDFRRRVLEDDLIKGIVRDYNIADSVIIEALAKSIPMKPIGGREVMECAVCDSALELSCLNNRPKFCYDCGQALDWSD